jgi:protein tyrosine phosphatase
MTQAPMENTIADFWKMVMEYEIGTIVMLNNLQEEYEVRVIKSLHKIFMETLLKDYSDVLHRLQLHFCKRVTYYLLMGIMGGVAV